MSAPVACLGPLPAELVARILLRLSLLERVRCAAVCRAWLTLLHSPEQHTRLDTRALHIDTRELLSICRLDGLRLRYPADSDTAAVIAALASRAGGALRSLALRSLAVDSDAHALALLPLLARGQPALAELRVGDCVKLPALNTLLGALARPLPACITAHCTLDSDALEPAGGGAALRALLAHAAGGSSTLHVTLAASFFFHAPGRMRQLGHLLARCAWGRVSLSPSSSAFEWLAGNADAAARRLVRLMEGLAEAAPPHGGCRVCIDLRPAWPPLSMLEAARLAQAVPRDTSLLLDAVCCTAADLPQLELALRPGFLAAAELQLDAALPPCALSAALEALHECMHAAPPHCATLEHDAPGFTVVFECGDGEAVDEHVALLAAWLLADAALPLAGLHLSLWQPHQLAALLPALPASLQRLHLIGDALTDYAVVELADALRAGQLPALRELHLGGRCHYSYPPHGLGEAAAGALARALARRTTPLHLLCVPPRTAAGLRALAALICTPRAACRVPHTAAIQLGEAIEAMMCDADAALACADAVRGIAAAFAPRLLRLVHLECDAGTAADMLVQDASPPTMYDADGRIVNSGVVESPVIILGHTGEVATLLLRLEQLAPEEVHAALCSDAVLAPLVQLVRRARWQRVVAPCRYFTPLLQRCLLARARSGLRVDADTLASCVAACHREHPAGISRRTSGSAAERSAAAMALLLACSLADEEAAEQPAYAAAAAFLARHAAWLFRTIARMHAAARSPAAPQPLQQAHQVTRWCVADAALYLTAAARVAPLADALPAAPAFPAILRALLSSQWARPAAGEPTSVRAAAEAYAALGSIAAHACDADWRRLAAAWRAADAASIDGSAGVLPAAAEMASTADVVVALLTDDVARLQRLAQDGGEEQAAAAAASAAAVLRTVQLRAVVPADA
jgi:hypothetical protein